MILYGPIYNIFQALSGGTPFSIYGGTHMIAGPEQATVFPIYGPMLREYAINKSYLLANNPFSLYGGMKQLIGPEPTHFPLYGPVYVTRLAPAKFTFRGPVKTIRLAPANITVYGSKLVTIYPSVNISGLTVSDIAISMTLPSPDVSYDIYPYLESDVKTVIGTDLPYRIVEHNLLFDTQPTGPITIVPYNRLQLYTEEIRQLTVTNTIPNRMDFTNIQVSGDFLFALNASGPWFSTLTVLDNFFIKAPALTQSSYTQQLLVTATATPRG